MATLELSNAEARRFMLLQQGLAGDCRFEGKHGVLSFVRQAGCLQFDPVDVCGRSADLTCLSRVADYDPSMLQALLYEDRLLVDHFDKNMAIFPVEAWPLLAGERGHELPDDERGHMLKRAAESVLADIAKNGPKAAADFSFDEKVDWYWAPTRLARAALEHLYFDGLIVVHSKKRNVKTYDLTERMLPAGIIETDVPQFDRSWYAERVYRRIRAVGLLWNQASDAWLGIAGRSRAICSASFHDLLEAGRIVPVNVEGISPTLYLSKEDMFWLDRIGDADWQTPVRTEFIAPLDGFMWDRRLIRALFDFHYRWEIYTAPTKREYGYYTLPILYGDRLIGRIEPYRDGETLRVRGLWWEAGVKPTAVIRRHIKNALTRLAGMNGLTTIDESMLKGR